MLDTKNRIAATQINRIGYAVTTVLESRAETPGVHLVRVAKPYGFDFRTSQAARLYLQTDDAEQAHPLSISSSPTRGYLEFAVRHSPTAFKRAFFALKPGDTVGIDGPYGRFFLDTEHPAILIAGGIGITPLKSMVEYATDVQLATLMTLIYSNRVPHEVAFKDNIDAMAKRNPYLDIIYTITRPESHHAWSYRTGRIDENSLRDVTSHKPDARFYIYGTPNMVHDTIQLLFALGIPPEHILQEQFRGYARHMEVAA
jgi:ferredoxin-NADP reductase